MTWYCMKLTFHSAFESLQAIIWGRVSKYARYGSKTAVMDVISFLCGSLGTSTVQLHDSLSSRHVCACSEAGFSSQMATMHEACTIKEQRSVVWFLWAKGLNAMDNHKEMFPVYGGKCLSHKAVHNWVEKFSRCSKVADDARPSTIAVEATGKRLLCCRFWPTGKAMGHMYQCWWRICREINAFSRFEYHMVYILYPFVTYLLTLPCICAELV
jgi:hypothetical protein